MEEREKIPFILIKKEEDLILNTLGGYYLPVGRTRGGIKASPINKIKFRFIISQKTSKWKTEKVKE